MGFDVLAKIQQDGESFLTTGNSVNNSELPSAIEVGDTKRTPG
jgi:hypothetical protein